MLNTIIFEDEGYRNLLPLAYWRTAFELRCGYKSLFDHLLDVLPAAEVTLYCRPLLAAVTAERFSLPVNRAPDAERVLLINGRLLATEPLALPAGPAVQWIGEAPAAILADRRLLDRLTPETLLDAAATRALLKDLPAHEFSRSGRLMGYSWDLVHQNEAMLRHGWRQAGAPAELAGRICPGAHLLNESAIHVGAGSVIKPGVVLDAENGPIYIGQGVVVSPNVTVEGPCYIGDGTLIQPGSALRDAMSIGRHCKVGGELDASIIHGYSNKQHDGFLGHSYVAEWVNLAADTVNSDLKNTYGTVRVRINGVEVESGQMFVGLTIGDHSKTGIGQMFPTGAVVGFGCNIATCEYTPKYVPSFTWLTAHNYCPYDIRRCLEVAKRVMRRRQITMTSAEEALFISLPELCGQIEQAPEPVSGNDECA